MLQQLFATTTFFCLQNIYQIDGDFDDYRKEVLVQVEKSLTEL
jgi:hypothetical protein